MHTTFRHFKSAPPPDAGSARRQNSRIPTKPNALDAERTQGQSSRHISDLAKGSSKASAGKTERDTRTSHPTPTTTPAVSSEARPTTSALSHVAVGHAEPTSSAAGHQKGLPPPPTIRTPSLVCGSSASTYGSPRSNMLRRKPSSIERYSTAYRSGTPLVESDGRLIFKRDVDNTMAFEDSVLGISMPPTRKSAANAAYNTEQANVQDVSARSDNLIEDFTPPMPGYASSATPSTRYTDSPFSHAPTPSSVSSYSPAIVAAVAGTTSRQREQSPIPSRPSLSIKSVNKVDLTRLGPARAQQLSTSSSKPNGKSADAGDALNRKVSTSRASSTHAASSSILVEPPRPTSRGKLIKTKEKEPSKAQISSKPVVHIPPELAHLNVDPPQKLSLNKSLPPLRPSRDNTPQLSGMADPSPVVKSDLPKLYTTYHKRTPSQETPTSPSVKQRFGLGLSSRSSSRQASPRIDSAISPPPIARSFARGSTPNTNAPSQAPTKSRRDSPAVGSSPVKSPRFGFFSRKPKGDIPKPPEKPKRLPTKGPTAGTGHEGYGRFGYRGRGQSVASSSGTRSPSVDSNVSSQPGRGTTSRKSSIASKDGSDLDDFLRERLEPKILRGSGSTVSATLSSSDAQALSAFQSSNASSLESFPKPRLLTSAMSSTTDLPVSKERTASESSNNSNDSQQSLSAARRSLAQISQARSRSPVKLPPPIVATFSARKWSIGSYDTRTDSSMAGRESTDAQAPHWTPPIEPMLEPKPSRKWNFFQRAQASPRSKGKERIYATVETLHTTARHPAYRGAAHYAMFESTEQVNLDEVAHIAQEASTSDDSTSEDAVPPKVDPYERRHASLLPPPAKLEFSKDSDFRSRPLPPRITVRQGSADSAELLQAHQVQPKQPPKAMYITNSPALPIPDDIKSQSESQPVLPYVQQAVASATPEMHSGSFDTAEGVDGNGSPRQPRLSPIGRIPKVVSKRDHDRKLSDNSFSRPFARTQPRPTVKPPGSLYNQIRELASPIESGSQPVSSTSTVSNGAAGEPKSSVSTYGNSASTNRTSMDIHPEFFALPPRKDSDVSYSGSSGNNSFMLPTYLQQEEDVWNEYNDFMDDVMLQRAPMSTASSLSPPFRYSSYLSDNKTSLSELVNGVQPPSTGLPHPPRSQTVPAVLSVPQQIARFMQPSMSPLTPHTLSDFVDQYCQSTSTLVSPMRFSGLTPSRSSLQQSQRYSMQVPSRLNLTRSISRSSSSTTRGSIASARHSRGSGHSRSAYLPEANARTSRSSFSGSARFDRDTQLLGIEEVDDSEQIADANLRFASLITSKWLSFGQVLFSPAHNEMRLADDPRVLIVDGLGSDWSWYVALAYEHATVYNLGPGMTAEWPGTNQRPPSNHRHISHASISAGFPFPKGFFTAVVLRFPVATTDSAYHACVFECKRVLRPGGYLEVAVLDLDLMNMGNRARRAVRGLKTRLQARDENISLCNLSDLLVRMIGRRGFEEVQRCMVGVPVAAPIPRSQDLSSSSPRGSAAQALRLYEDRASPDITYDELLNNARDHNSGVDREENQAVSTMIAKVGRWWYTSCYEKSLLHTDRSIWNDNALLHECEKQETSFKLLICCAQKPTQSRRRTVSV